jgi:hypothetical protein
MSASDCARGMWGFANAVAVNSAVMYRQKPDDGIIVDE